MNYIFAGSSIVIKSPDFVMTYIDTVVKAPRLWYLRIVECYARPIASGIIFILEIIYIMYMIWNIFTVCWYMCMYL